MGQLGSLRYDTFASATRKAKNMAGRMHGREAFIVENVCGVPQPFQVFGTTLDEIADWLDRPEEWMLVARVSQDGKVSRTARAVLQLKTLEYFESLTPEGQQAVMDDAGTIGIGALTMLERERADGIYRFRDGQVDNEPTYAMGGPA